jgi:KTSC domain
MSSSNVAAAGYDHGFKILRVRFVRGATYDYLEVPAIVYKELLDASSKDGFQLAY